MNRASLDRESFAIDLEIAQTVVLKLKQDFGSSTKNFFLTAQILKQSGKRIVLNGAFQSYYDLLEVI